MALGTAKLVEIFFDKVLETTEDQMQMLPLVTFIEPSPGGLQNSGNVIWRPVEQQSPLIAGWDLTGEETGIIQQAYPAQLGTPSNDFVRVRADDMRDKRFWEERGVRSGKRQITELNRAIAAAIGIQGSMFYRSNATDGFEFIGEAQTMMNEKQEAQTERYFVLNDRDNLTFASDLASRQTIKGRPADAWATGQIGSQVAEFDVFTGSFMPLITGAADPAITVTGAQSFAPQEGTVVPTIATGVVTNYDYRQATIVISDDLDLAVGDKVTFANTGTDVQSITLADKQATGQAMTFTIVEITDATHIVVYPRPIALDDAGLTSLEKAYANIDTQIGNAATLLRLNIDASKKTNIFWDKAAVEVIGGAIPAELFSEFAGMKMISETMPNGLTMYMVYDGDIATMNFRYRLFTWWGVTIANPASCGVAVTF